MAITAGNGNNAVSAKDNIAILTNPASYEEHAAARIRLTQALQTSLDLTTLLEIFLEHARAIVPVGGLVYGNGASESRVQLGMECAQTLNYRLQTPQQDMGNITFSRRKRFNKLEIAALENLLSTLIFPLRNALLYRQAVLTSLLDPLTCVGNRQAMEEALAREISLARRHRQPLSMLVIDVDHFKSINDNYGHSSGDDVLRLLASTIRTIARTTDLTFRYGGEEFVLLLNKTDAEGAAVIAERVRSQIEDLIIGTEPTCIRITASIGVSSWRRGEKGEDLFRRGDSALYQAKRDGRNRVVIAN
ncbi:MAG: GGDEF domain-containing protein [Gammaproteobacteria bacterium]|nr:GGDEF domain-containing protein [Gammaproteobacteria bacterium]